MKYDVEVLYEGDSNFNLSLTRLDYDGNNLYVVLGEDDSELIVLHFYSPLIFQASDECFRVDSQISWRSIGLLLVAKNSKYLDFFRRESGLYSSDENLKHFVVYTDSDYIDIISLDKPRVTKGRELIGKL